ncbi:hypothetical protein ON010_g10027 [Phytophthora cinnamomi]|nr:hypothetical protein ON010_g10027 [Phytophthora cinnamomi]
MRLRSVAYEHPADPCDPRDSKGDEEEDQIPRLTEGTDAGETTDADEEEEAAQAARSSLSQQQQQKKTSAVVHEIVWERQRLDGSSDVDVWAPAEFDLMNGIATFTSCNRGDIGQNIADVVPARLLNKPHLWISDWDVDHSLPHCDEEGWVYAASYADFGRMEEPLVAQETGAQRKSEGNAVAGEQKSEANQERLVRRRRLIRKRCIDGSDLSWFQELLDCRALNELEEDRDQYESFITQFSDEERASARAFSVDCDYDADAWNDDPELRALEEEERRLQAELEAIEDETAQISARRRELWSTGTDLEKLVHGTFGEGAFLQHLLGLSRDERQSVSVFNVHASDMLRRLQRYNVCNDVFHIWHDGLFGTINGLRLGRLPSKPVEWVEINAALGQAVLLLATIADRANFEFSRNRLVPRGSFSRVVNMYGREYNLFSDGGMFRRRGFNQAIILFLECVEDAGRRAMKEEPSLKFPYKVERGKIGGLPISLGNDEQWTRALKYMLTHLKWLLAWISKPTAPGGRSPGSSPRARRLDPAPPPAPRSQCRPDVRSPALRALRALARALLLRQLPRAHSDAAAAGPDAPLALLERRGRAGLGRALPALVGRGGALPVQPAAAGGHPTRGVHLRHAQQAPQPVGSPGRRRVDTLRRLHAARHPRRAARLQRLVGHSTAQAQAGDRRQPRRLHGRGGVRPALGQGLPPRGVQRPRALQSAADQLHVPGEPVGGDRGREDLRLSHDAAHPWTARAFHVARGFADQQHWAKVPADVDVLVTHGPPHGILDTTVTGLHVGSETLLKESMSRIRPSFHLFGHIHEAYGATRVGNTVFVNAATSTLLAKPKHAPVVVDIPIKC